MGEWAWVPCRMPDGNICVCLELRVEPFMWTIVEIGEIDFHESGNFTYPWRLIHLGYAKIEDVHGDNREFTKYIERAIIARVDELEEQENGESNEISDIGNT